jgi:protein TonB
MFADSFCDTNWDNQSHRGWTTLLSFGLQAIFVASLLVLPFLYTQGLPSLISPSRLLVPMTLPRAPRIEAIGDTARFVTIVPGHPLFTPRHIPNVIPQSTASDLQPPSLNTAISGQSGTGNPGEGIFASTGDSLPVVISHPSISTHHLLISHMMEGNLIRRVEPAYPAIARQARIQGIVLLRATISKDGTIENLQLLSGHPMLAQAAIETVRQWRYRPYYLNGDPVEVETQVTVKFTLSGG